MSAQLYYLHNTWCRFMVYITLLLPSVEVFGHFVVAVMGISL